ncbi:MULTISPECIES: STM4015 family protein [unclassified Aureispira]|uniref:STM4015 family protein n=1 Tax=unclassified Aureispira TaxID=2649989 RepID=UPI000698DB5C|nr:MULTISPECIES: STM4015 family protein [unclassified Aureispira]WMX16064.1 STM4015 family protein [Aureispira sp. CCB-E]
MTFSRNAFYFNKKKVVDFDIEKGIENPDLAYRFRTEYDGPEDEVKNMLTAFLNDPKLGEIDSFVIGYWGPEHDDSPKSILQLLVDNKDKLQHIKGIFTGDITYEENEVSWIENCNHGPLLAALPNLEFYQVRGGNGLSFGDINHPNLKKLVIQTGGLDKSVYAELSKANLPALEHLELWLGSDYYGFNATPEEVAIAYRGAEGKTNHLPSLKYLGLRNSEIANELAQLMKGDPILDRIETLDFSRGIIDDRGAEALVDNPAIKNLKKLDLHHNFISDEWAEKLEDLGIKVDLKEREPDADEDDRYISVSE